MLYAIANVIAALFLFGRLAAPGITTLIVALFFFGGVQLFFIGLLGEYVLAIYGQTRRKPLIVERERINFDAGVDDPKRPFDGTDEIRR